MSVAERLKIYINHLEMTNTAFERSIGASNGYINSIRKSIGLDKIEQIGQNYPTLNIVWLLKGEGEMLKADETQMAEGARIANTQQQSQEVGAKLVLEEDTSPYYLSQSGIRHYHMANGMYQMLVPYVPIAGYNDYTEGIRKNGDGLIIDQYSFIVPQIGYGKYLAFEIKGDSMDNDTRNSLTEGDIVLGRELSRDLWAQTLHIEEYPNWIIVLDNNVLCKQIVAHNLKKGTITCRSLNPSPQYSNFELAVKDIRQLFNIVQRVSSMIS